MVTSYRLLILVLLISFVTSQPLSSDDFKQEAILDQEHNFRMWWNYNSTHILIQIRMNTTGWIGVGFSELGSMVRADIHVGWVKDGKAFLTDRHGVDRNARPPLDSEQNAKLIEGRECNGETIITFVRQLAACQLGEDREILSSTTKVIYAFSKYDRDPVDDLAWSDTHGFKNRGSKSLLLLQPNAKNIPITDPQAKTFDIVADGQPLPIKPTFYKCLLVKRPELNKTHHVIKNEPIINKTYIRNVHHLILASCSDRFDSVLETFYGSSGDCYSGRHAVLQQLCSVPLGGWAVGGGADIYPDNVGMPIGDEGNSRFVRLEIHYDNPNGEEIRDNSGMRFTYTPRLREHHAGSMGVGIPSRATHIIIPPNVPDFKAYGECPSSCLGGAMKKAGVDHINIFGVLPHSHLAGRKIELRHFRGDLELPPILKDDSYDFAYQQRHVIEPHVKVDKGDEITSVCSYSSMGKSRPIVGGLDTTKEMCLNFVRYYPRLPIRYCTSAPISPVNDYLKRILGITDVLDTGVNKHSRQKSIDDWIVQSPQDKVNQTVGDVMSSYTWDADSVRGLENAWKRTAKLSVCLGPQPEIPVAQVVPPMEERTPYQSPPPRRCTAPYRGFLTEKQAATCQAGK